MTVRRIVLSAVLAATLPAPAFAQEAAVAIPYDRLATRIVDALHLAKGERVLLRYDPATLGPLEVDSPAGIPQIGGLHQDRGEDVRVDVDDFAHMASRAGSQPVGKGP